MTDRTFERTVAPAGGAPAPDARRLAGRRIALGITGSIAAFKAVELLRLLQAEGADVRVLMTRAATAFTSPLTLATLSGHPVDSDILALQPDGRIGHIVGADEVDAVVVAPATAHWLAAMAIGLADDVITATCLATEAPVVVAPAMDGGMYGHPATRSNVARLRDVFGYRIVEPESGALASGQTGRGRLATLATVVDAVVAAVAAAAPPAGAAADLAGWHVVVTAGGTAEPLDPVRFVGNRSTGKMGVAIAEAALDRGASVTLIAGNTSVALPERARIVRAETTAAMERALTDVLVAGRVDALVMAAAVADFRPAHPAAEKLHRGDGLTLELEPTPDLLAGVARSVHERPAVEQPILIGFAAETGSIARATEKLRSKGVDLLVANDVAEAGSGFGTDTNRVTVHAADGSVDPWPQLSKREVGDRLLDRIVQLRAARAARSNAPAVGEPGRSSTPQEVLP